MEGGRGGWVGWEEAFAEMVPPPSLQPFLLPTPALLPTTPVAAPSEGQVILALRPLLPRGLPFVCPRRD